jgi:hypothetical protein
MAGQIEAGKAVVRVEANRSRLGPGLAAAQKELRAFAAGAGKLGAAGLAGAAAVLAPLTAAVKHFADTGSQLDDMSQRTGASVEALSGLGYAAQMSGASLEDVEKGLRTMQKGLAADDEGFGELGISIEKLKGFAPEDQMRMIANEIAKIENPADRAAAAMGIFGKSGANLLPMLQNGAEGIDMLVAEADALGVVMSGEDANAAAVLGDSIDKVGISAGSLVNTLAAQLAPAFTAVLGVVTYFITSARDWIAANQGVVLTIAAAAVVIGILGAGLVASAGLAYAMSVAYGVLGAVVSGVSTVMSILASVLTGGMAAAPILVIGALAGLVGYLLYASGTGGEALEWLSSKFTMLSEIAGPVFKGIQDAMAGGDFTLAAQILWEGIQLAWIKGTADIANTFRTSLNSMLGVLDGWMANFRSRWNDVSGWIADRMLELQGQFDSSFDVETAKKFRREDTQWQNQGFAAGVKDRAAGRDTAAQAAEQATKERIAALEAKLAESLAEAVKVSDAADEKKLNAAKYIAPDPADYKSDINEAYKSKSPENLGTSSGFAAMLQSMAGGGALSLDQQMYTEAKVQSKLLGQIVNKMAKGATLKETPEFS